jgi:hypothetical protein
LDCREADEPTAFIVGGRAMTIATELPPAGIPEIDKLPPEKRVRVVAAMLMAFQVDDQVFADRPDCHTFIRPAYPDEIAAAEKGEVGLVVVRRGEGGNSLYSHIRIRTNLSTDEFFKNEAFKAYFQSIYGQNPGSVLPSKLPTAFVFGSATSNQEKYDV